MKTEIPISYSTENSEKTNHPVQRLFSRLAKVGPTDFNSQIERACRVSDNRTNNRKRLGKASPHG
jgi:predicted oxidoreductase (fatty acid repression mutant protein)